MKPFDKQEYNKMCAEFLGWELHLAKTALNWQDGTFMDWDDEEEFWVENPTEEFKKFRIVCHPEQVGLGYDFKLFKSHHYKSGLQFHTDWNWIMEVVEKFKPIVFMSKTRALTDHNTNLRYALMSAEKEKVVQAIWEFLIWYKTQTV